MALNDHPGIANSGLSALRARIANMKGERSTPAVQPSLRERCDERARAAFCAAFIAMGVPENELANRIGVCARMIRDYRSGARSVPSWVLCALPREGQLVAFDVLVDGVPETDEVSERGAA